MLSRAIRPFAVALVCLAVLSGQVSVAGTAVEAGTHAARRARSGPSSSPTASLASLERPDPDILRSIALHAVTCATAAGAIGPPPTLTVIDYSRPSTEPRLWVYDLPSGDQLFTELVAHGRNSGEDQAVRFSDEPESHQSSLGLFVAGETYVGAHGYSLRLDGLEPGFNGRARERAIVVHGAPYVDATLAARQGRLGRSLGCPALREAIADRVIDTVRDGGVIFAYYPDADWLRHSRFLHCGQG